MNCKTWIENEQSAILFYFFFFFAATAQISAHKHYDSDMFEMFFMIKSIRRLS